jgi:hypothetical protein
VLELAIGDVVILARLVRRPDDGGLLAERVEMAIDTVEAGIETPAPEPGEVHLLHVHIQDSLRRVIPTQQLLCLSSPKLLGLIRRLTIQPFVLLHRIDVGSLRDLGLDGNHRGKSSRSG